MQEKDGLVLYQGRVYIPPDGQLRHEIVAALHNSPIMGHSSQWKMMDYVECAALVVSGTYMYADVPV